MTRWCCFVFLLLTISSNAQYFGRNKPHYKTFRFDVTRTSHFDFYTYLRNDSIVTDFARLSEAWYSHHQKILKDTIPFRNPLIVYNTPADFQQTTAIQGPIGAGTGGVTEGMKNRVVMPLMETHRQTSHVLGHELVHAFQYSLMREADSISIYTADVPLWMVEGMAEYMSIGNRDTHTAMWMRDAVLNNDIPTLEKMSKDMRYFPYRYGQAFWSYVAGTYGDSVIKKIFMNAAKNGYQHAIKTVLGINDDSLSKSWATSLKAHYGKFRDNTIPLPMTSAVISDENAGSLNVSPKISPDGKYIAFFSEKEVFTINLFLAEVGSGKIIKTLSSTKRNTDIDELSFIESGGAWTPDSRQFAYVVYEKGRNMLYVIDVASGKTVHSYQLPGLDFFSNPTWSPDGKRIAVAGTIKGVSDIYVFEPSVRTLHNITSDKWSDIQPDWSTDGSTIIFSSDRPKDQTQVRSSTFSICSLDLTTRKVHILPGFEHGDQFNPVYSAKDTSIYFLADPDGIRNIYSYSLASQKLFKLTNVFTGISGITEYSPAISVARNTGMIVYSFYNQKKYSIYSHPVEKLAGIPVETSIKGDANVLPPGKSEIDPPESLKVKQLAKITKAPYRPRFKLDFIGNSGVGVVAGRFGTGLAGGVNAMFSDIVGNNMLLTGLSMNGRITDIAGTVAFINQKHKVQLGGMVSHIPYRAGFNSYEYVPFTVGADTVMVDKYITDIVRIVENMVGVFAYYPLSQTRRIEAGTTLSFYKYSQERINTFMKEGARIQETKEDVPSLDPYGFLAVNTAYVVDNSFFGIASPMKGRRTRYEVQEYLDGLKVTAVLADQRYYTYVKPVAFAIRGLYTGRYGADANTTRLTPLFLGYPTLVRGYDAYSLYERNKENISVDALTGSQIAILNGEVRLPFTGPKRLAVITSNYIFTELALFADAGTAWRADKAATTGTETLIPVPDKMKPVYSAGLSLRINLFGMLVLEPFYALPLTKGIRSKGIFGLNFAPGW